MRAFRLNTRPSFVTYYHNEDDLNPVLRDAMTWANEGVFSWLGKVEKPVTLAGGALRSYFLNTPVKDYDLYSSKTDLGNDLKRRDYHWSIIQDTDRSSLYRRPQLTPKGIQTQNVNIINNKSDDPTMIIDSYDFTVCMCAITKEKDDLWITYHPDYFLDLTGRKLRIHNPENMMNTIWRVQKYIKYGFELDREEMWKIIEGIHDLPALPVLRKEEKNEDKQTTTLESLFSGS